MSHYSAPARSGCETCSLAKQTKNKIAATVVMQDHLASFLRVMIFVLMVKV